MLIALYLGDAPGHPIGTEVDLNREGNLPTYFAASQLAVVGVLTAVATAARFVPRHARTWLLWVLPVLFLTLATDEVLRLHEDIGLMLDDLPGADRRDLPFDRTGIWMFALGLPFSAALIWYGYLIRDLFPADSMLLAGIGFAIFMGGAIGIETLANFVDPGSRAETLQVLGEEGLELVGVTIILWAVDAVVRSDLANRRRLRQNTRRSAA